VVDLDDEVIKVIGALEAVARMLTADPDRLVVMTVGWIFTPGIVFTNWANRKKGPWPRMTIGTPPQAARPKHAARRAAIAFVLVGDNPPAPQRDRDRAIADHEPTPVRVARGGLNPNCPKRPESGVSL
jgi:hypothetical protein